MCVCPGSYTPTDRPFTNIDQNQSRKVLGIWPICRLGKRGPLTVVLRSRPTYPIDSWRPRQRESHFILWSIPSARRTIKAATPALETCQNKQRSKRQPSILLFIRPSRKSQESTSLPRRRRRRRQRSGRQNLNATRIHRNVIHIRRWKSGSIGTVPCRSRKEHGNTEPYSNPLEKQQRQPRTRYMLFTTITETTATTHRVRGSWQRQRRDRMEEYGDVGSVGMVVQLFRKHHRSHRAWTSRDISMMNACMAWHGRVWAPHHVAGTILISLCPIEKKSQLPTSSHSLDKVTSVNFKICHDNRVKLKKQWLWEKYNSSIMSTNVPFFPSFPSFPPVPLFPLFPLFLFFFFFFFLSLPSLYLFIY